MRTFRSASLNGFPCPIDVTFSPAACESTNDRATARILSSRAACTAWKSPGEAIGKPASMTSTPRFDQSFTRLPVFRRVFMLQPGDCSPSRNVVSKIVIWRDMGGGP